MVPPSTVVPTAEMPLQCRIDQFSIAIRRTCGSYPMEESFKIYEGTQLLPNRLVHKQYSCIQGNEFLCLNPGVHTVVLLDYFGDGWDKDSILVVSSNNTFINFHLNSGFNNTQIVDFAFFLSIPFIPQCNDDQVLIQLNRTCGNNPSQESFEIYEGTDIQQYDKVIYSQVIRLY